LSLKLESQRQVPSGLSGSFLAKTLDVPLAQVRQALLLSEEHVAHV